MYVDAWKIANEMLLRNNFSVDTVKIRLDFKTFFRNLMSTVI